MKRFLLILTLALFVGGCAGYGYYDYSNLTQLKLKQPITVQAGSSYAYIKAPGQVVSRGDIKTYELYCKFSIPRSKDSDELIIAPDVFNISHVYKRVSNIFPARHQYQVAFGGIFHRHDSSKQDLELYMKIHSVNQPQVQSLTCVRFADPYFGYSPTIKEVQQVFAGLAEFTASP